MYIPDHKPILLLATTSVATATLHAAVPSPLNPPVLDMFAVVEQWVHLIGGIVGILAGVASVSWYVYSYVRSKK